MPLHVLASDVPQESMGSLRIESSAAALAPMRVSLAGGGTDIPPIARGIGGRVVCAAIDLHVRAEVSPFDPGWVALEGSWGVADASMPPLEATSAPPSSRRVLSMDRWGPRSARSRALQAGAALRRATFTRRADEPPSTDVAFRLLEAVRAAMGVTDGVHISIESDLTPGTGLGGSAATAAALLLAFYRAAGRTIAPRPLAAAALKIERELLGLRCGLQDQLCAAVGGVLDLRFREDGIDVCPISPQKGLLRDLTAGLLLIDTRIRRVSGDVLDIAYDHRAHELHADLVAAADDTARGFRLGSLPLILAGMRRSASAKLRRGGASSLPWEWVKKLSCLGAVVVRVCGAGGGGHLLVWADPRYHAEICRAVEPCIVRRPSLGVSGAAEVGAPGPADLNIST